jgi:hypothetical protein
MRYYFPTIEGLYGLTIPHVFFWGGCGRIEGIISWSPMAIGVGFIQTSLERYGMYLV